MQEFLWYSFVISYEFDKLELCVHAYRVFYTISLF